MSKVIRLLIGIPLVGVAVYFAVWCLQNPSDSMPYSIYAAVMFALGVILIASAIVDIIKNPYHPKDKNARYCANHPNVRTTEFCWKCGEWFCDDCLVPYDGAHNWCNKCVRIDKLQKEAAAKHIPYKSKTVALVLCLLFGAFGIHRFYLGKMDGMIPLLITITGILIGRYFLIVSAGIAIVNLIQIASGSVRDNYERELI